MDILIRESGIGEIRMILETNLKKENDNDQNAPIEKRHPVIRFIKRLVKEKPLGTFSLIIILVLVITAIFANFLAPYGMNETNPMIALSPPSTTHLLGTDNLGRDLLSRVIYGARISITVGFAATLFSIIISTLIGLISGFIGGWLDMIIQRFVDAWMGFPGIILLIVLISIIGPGLLQVILVLGLAYGITGSRIVRSAVISIKENVYVEAARAIGTPTWKLLMRHILPNVLSTIIVLFSVRVPAVIMTEASLSFLGFGIPPPTASWGGMLSGAGRQYMFMAPWIAIWPGLALALTVYSINMFGDTVRDLLDPRLRGGVGRYGVEVKRQ